MIVAQLDKDGFYMGTVEDYGGPMPHGCQTAFPPAGDLPAHCRWRWTGADYEQTPDYRGVDIYRADGGSERLTTWGPLPEGFSLTPPEPPPVVPDASAVKAEAARRLAPTDWLVVRQAEGGKSIPEVSALYRTAVRAASDRLEAMELIPADYTDDKHWPESMP